MALGACASAEATPEAPAVRDLDAVVRARLATAELDGEHRVRFNPVACDCPELEVFVAGIWHRVALVDGDPGILDLLRAALAEGREQAATREYLVAGRISDVPGRCGRAALYLTLEPEIWLGQRP